MASSAPPILESLSEYVGATPVLHLNKLNPTKGVDIYAKLECMNPMSIKVRLGERCKLIPLICLGAGLPFALLASPEKKFSNNYRIDLQNR